MSTSTDDIYEAIETGQIETVKSLLDHNHNLDLNFLLMYASELNELEIAELLIKKVLM